MITIFTDGACFGNPGPMGIGVVIYKDNQKIHEQSQFIGNGTNNIAEYRAVISAIEFIGSICLVSEKILIKSDSQLLVRQLNGEYKVRDKTLFQLYQKIKSFKLNISFVHIDRELNTEADKLSKQAIEVKK